MQLHHAVRVVFYWTLFSNLSSAFIAILLMKGALGLLRNHPGAGLLSRQAIKAFFGILAGSAVVSWMYLLPPILAMWQDPLQHSMGLILMVSVFSALIGLAVMLSGLFLCHGFLLRRGRLT